ncbi:uncharacterized protein LOC124144268 [Haliotis rufescens]|uniref:uncharacterized protein LOC124144268 n=1 Tax=Haliotis rufescens TaxID=6454 RepID=UPI00201E7A95|nr:uncharacterized protein LOC124144268 [Haliotis rufescens]
MSRGTMDTISIWSVVLAMSSLATLLSAQDRIYDMDRLATCGQDVTVFDKDVVLNGRSNAAPSNPPLECTVYLTSGYTESDGRYRLQIIIEAIDIQDCQVHVDVFNGRGAFGSYLRSLGCNSMSTDTLYTEGREATVRFTRPSILYQTAYAFTFKIRTYRDIDEGGYVQGTNKLSPGAIIGIVIGIVALFVVAILILWCYKSGRFGNYYGGGYAEDDNMSVTKTTSMGELNGGHLEKSESLGSAIDYRDPGVWTSVTNGQYTPSQPRKLGRNFYQKNENRYGNEGGRQLNNLNMEGQGQGYRSGNGQRLDSAYDDSYEPYDRDANVKLNMDKDGNAAEWKKDEGTFERNGSKRASTGSKGQGGQRSSYVGEGDGQGEGEEGQGTFKRDNGARGSRGSKKGGEAEPGQPGYDSFARDAPGGTKLRSSDRDSTRGSKRGKKHADHPGAPEGEGMDVAEATESLLNAAPPSGPKGDISNDKHFFPDSDNEGVNPDSMDLQSEPELNMPNPSKASPSAKKRKKKRGKDGNIPGSDLPPEAQEPVFTTSAPEAPYDPSASLPYTAYGAPSYDAMYPNQYGMPYGMMPMAGGFAPMPGQNYAYYQMGPMPGAPATGMPTDQQPMVAGQAAWYVQDTPQGPVKKGFMMTTSQEPSQASKKKRRDRNAPDDYSAMDHPGGPGYTSTPGDALTPKRGRKNRPNIPIDPMDISVIAAGGPPPEPGAGQRSAVMRAGTDPHTGMQTNQVMWRDTIVDPSDPPPDANPQITRKTLTRITTRSGKGDLPTDQNPMGYNDYSDRLGIEEENPAYLSPSRPALPPAAVTPDTSNVDFYLGQGRHTGAPEPVVHKASSRNKAFRDRIAVDDSYA